jgi:hypothetical protein
VLEINEKIEKAFVSLRNEIDSNDFEGIKIIKVEKTFDGVLFDLAEEIADYNNLQHLQMVLEGILQTSFSFAYLHSFPDSRDPSSSGWQFKIFFDRQRYKEVTHQN